MDGYEYVAQLEWQVENQQRIIRGLEADIKRLEAEITQQARAGKDNMTQTTFIGYDENEIPVYITEEVVPGAN